MEIYYLGLITFIQFPGLEHLTGKYSTIAVISACISLQVLQLEAPAYVKYGQPIVLKCDFDLAGKTLYRCIFSYDMMIGLL